MEPIYYSITQKQLYRYVHIGGFILGLHYLQLCIASRYNFLKHVVVRLIRILVQYHAAYLLLADSSLVL